MLGAWAAGAGAEGAGATRASGRAERRRGARQARNGRAGLGGGGGGGGAAGAGLRGRRAGDRARHERAAGWRGAREAHGVGAWGARPGHACARRVGVLAGQLGQVGAQCTWLSSDSVFGPDSTRYFS